MNRDTQYYREEDNEQQNEPQEIVENENMEEIDDMQFFSQLIDYMRDALLAGFAVPLTNGNKRVVDVPKCMQILDDMEKNLPAAIQYGLHMYSERDRIKGKAENAAIDRVSSAECRAQNILQKAESSAAQILADATHDAEVIRADADEYARNLVAQDSITAIATKEANTMKADARLAASETRMKANNDAYSLLSDLESYLSNEIQGLQQRMKDLNNMDE